jgi:hypothetical protein
MGQAIGEGLLNTLTDAGAEPEPIPVDDTNLAMDEMPFAVALDDGFIPGYDTTRNFVSASGLLGEVGTVLDSPVGDLGSSGCQGSVGPRGPMERSPTRDSSLNDFPNSARAGDVPPVNAASYRCELN